jgi:hypothetical protein
MLETMLETVPVVPKLCLMLLVVVQTTWHKAHVEPSAVVGIYALALCVLVACCLPAAVYSVLDRERTATFLLHTAALMLATACGMHYLLQHGDTGLASVWLQTMLTHVFYCVGKTAHVHKQRHVLPNRRSVRVVCVGCLLLFPLLLTLRCAAHVVDLSVALMVMFAGEIAHFAVSVATLLLGSVAQLYERCFVGD